MAFREIMVSVAAFNLAGMCRFGVVTIILTSFISPHMATAKFHLNHPHEKGTKILRKEEVPIDLMFTIDRKHRFLITTGERIKPKYWDKKEKAVKSTFPGHLEINRHLDDLKTKVLLLCRDNKNQGFANLKEIIRKEVSNESSEKKKVIEAIRLFIAQSSQEKELPTVKMYTSILKKFIAFNPELTFEQLDHNFHDAFKAFLYATKNPIYGDYRLHFDAASNTWILKYNKDAKGKDLPVGDSITVGLMDDTVFKYLVHIKTICKWAGDRGYNVHPSHKDWKIIKRSYPIISLNLDELQSVEALQNLPQHLEIAKDYLSIACRTGQRISDVKRINALTINSGVWVVLQKKGSRMKQKEIHLPLIGFCAPVVAIVEKWGGQLPATAEQNLNINIKEVCKRAGITQDIFIERWAGNKKIRIPGKKYEYISSHSGKKSFITILANSGTPIKIVSDLTGTSIRTIEKHYLGKTDDITAGNYLKSVQESITTLKKVI